MHARSIAAALALALAACSEGAPVAPVEVVTLDDLPATEAAQLQQEELAELARIEAQRSASAPHRDSLADAWRILNLSWVQKGVVLACAPRDYDGVARIIGPEGATLSSGVATLHIPPGALARPVVITMETPVSLEMQVQFKPHGLAFLRKATLTFDYAGCRRPKKHSERVVYLGDANEALEWPTAFDRDAEEEVDAAIGHFSRYAVAF